MKIKITLALMTVAAFLLTTVGTSLAATPTDTSSGGSSSTLYKDSQCDPAAKATCVSYDPNADKCSVKQEAACNPVQDYLNPFIKLLSGVAGLAIVIGIIYAGIQYSMSEGDPQKVSAAKRHAKNSVIALFAFLFLYAFLKFLAPGLIVG